MNSIAEIYSHYLELFSQRLDEEAAGGDFDHEQETNLRAVEARRFTKILNEHTRFDFLRMGDMELSLLLAAQDGLLPESFASQKNVVNGSAVEGDPGISATMVERLRESYSKSSFVDYNQTHPVIQYFLGRLEGKLSEALTAMDPRGSYFLPVWVLQEFKSYCESQGRVIGIAGAEADLLEWLSKTPEFQKSAAGVWPENAQMHFHQVRENGRNLSSNIETIKNDIRMFVMSNNITTLFISLGGAAKIIAHELSHELTIQAIDFGAMTRSLCDLGSDGQNASRSTHSIISYRLPIRLVVQGLIETRGCLEDCEVLAKIHAQIIHQLHPHMLGRSLIIAQNANWRGSSRKRFRVAFGETQMLRSQFEGDACDEERFRFNLFCGDNRLLYSRVPMACSYSIRRRICVLVKYGLERFGIRNR